MTSDGGAFRSALGKLGCSGWMRAQCGFHSAPCLIHLFILALEILLNLYLLAINWFYQLLWRFISTAFTSMFSDLRDGIYKYFNNNKQKPQKQSYAIYIQKLFSLPHPPEPKRFPQVPNPLRSRLQQIRILWVVHRIAHEPILFGVRNLQFVQPLWVSQPHLHERNMLQ